MEYVLAELCEQVAMARAAQRPIFICGGGSKDFYGEQGGRALVTAHTQLDMSGYQGVVNYEPSELVITARAGTLLSDIERTLDEHGQMLAFEPPRFGEASTLGGCIAAGLSGPRRMAAGSARDFVLGSQLLDSSGALLRFGGEVMKNVAGYDVSRLMVGSMGIFGALVEVSVKVLPKPFHEATLLIEADEARALELLSSFRSLPLPLSASAWLASNKRTKKAAASESPGQTTAAGSSAAVSPGQLWIRLSGSQAAVRNAIQKIGGEQVEAAHAQAFWNSLRDHTHGFFQTPSLWRMAVPPDSGPLGLGDTLIEWNGGQRWLTAGPERADELRAAAASKGGHATLFRCEADANASAVPVFHPPQPAVMNISRRLKEELDPMGIFNPRRMFTDF